MIRARVVRAIFAVWVLLWVAFTARELFLKGQLRDYRRLIDRSLDGKRSYVTGDRLYGFLAFCAGLMPEGASYAVAGLEDGSLDKRRMVYYLYPRTEKADGEYLLVYDAPAPSDGVYRPWARLDEGRYIMKRSRSGGGTLACRRSAAQEYRWR